MKKSFLFSALLFIVLVAALVIVFVLFSDNYIISIPSPDLYYDIVSIDYTDEKVVDNTAAFELEGYSYFVITSVGEGNADVTISYSNYETGEEGGTYHYDGFRVNSLGMIYSKSLANDFHYWQLIFVAAALYFLILALWFRRRFTAMKGENIFDYRVVFYCTLMLMSLIFAFVFTLSSVLLLTRFTELTAASALSLVSVLVIIVIAFTLPLALIFSVLVSVSNISLIRHEGFRPINMLGIVTGTALSAAITVCVIVCAKNYAELIKSPLYITAANIAALIILFFELILVSVAICALSCLKRRSAKRHDYIIILGCGIRKDGSLSPLLRGRVDRALDHYRHQLEKFGSEAVFIPSGGKGEDELISEGEAMRRYLVEQGISDSQILPEENSRTTFENMRFSKEIIDSRSGNAAVVFSTTKYHVFRSGMYAAMVGLKADGIGSPTRWYFWPNAFLREFAGFIVAYRKAELLMGLSASVLVAIITNLQSILTILS